jgi:hypothetical protein
MGLLTHASRMSGPTLGRVTQSKRCGTHGTKSRQQLLSAWQESFSLGPLDLLVLVKLPSAMPDLEELVECYLTLVEC